MELMRFQAALARLLTDEKAREMLRENPEAFSDQLQLDSVLLDGLQHSLNGGIESFASALIQKREKEAGHVIPATRRILGEAFKSKFRFFMGSSSETYKNPSTDALNFLSWLTGSAEMMETCGHRDWVRLERIRLQMRLTDRAYAVGVFRLTAGVSEEHGERWMLIFWWKNPFSKRLVHWNIRLK